MKRIAHLIRKGAPFTFDGRKIHCASGNSIKTHGHYTDYIEEKLKDAFSHASGTIEEAVGEIFDEDFDDIEWPSEVMAKIDELTAEIKDSFDGMIFEVERVINNGLARYPVKLINRSQEDAGKRLVQDLGNPDFSTHKMDESGIFYVIIYDADANVLARAQELGFPVDASQTGAELDFGIKPNGSIELKVY